MKIRFLYSLALLAFISGFAQANDNQDYVSLSIGQFDINDNKDSSEYRIEFLSGEISMLSPGNLSLK